MFHRILVGVDGGPDGRDAIALAVRLAASDAELTLAHVYRSDPRGTWRDLIDDAVRADADAVLNGERDATGVHAELRSIGAASVGRGLHEFAESHAVDLIVVGSCHRTRPERLIEGNDTRASLNGAPCAIAIAPHGYADTARPFRRIGVGYDGSRESVAALAAARELAAVDGSTIDVRQVVTAPLYLYSPGVMVPGGAIDAIIEDAQAQLDSLVGVNGTVVYGVINEELVAFGNGRDLLVIGSRGYGPTKRLIHGSTSSNLAGNVDFPLLVLPRVTVDAQPAGERARALVEANG